MHNSDAAATDQQKAADRAFVQHSFEIASLSTDGQMILLPHSTHGVHFDRPEDVSRIIEEVVVRARR